MENQKKSATPVAKKAEPVVSLSDRKKAFRLAAKAMKSGVRN